MLCLFEILLLLLFIESVCSAATRRLTWINCGYVFRECRMRNCCDSAKPLDTCAHLKRILANRPDRVRGSVGRGSGRKEMPIPELWLRCYRGKKEGGPSVKAALGSCSTKLDSPLRNLPQRSSPVWAERLGSASMFCQCPLLFTPAECSLRSL
jgi:hypothetical protein